MVKPRSIPHELVMPGNIVRLKRVKLDTGKAGVTTVVSGGTSVVTGTNGVKVPLHELVREYRDLVLGKRLAGQSNSRLPVQIIHVSTGSGEAMFTELQAQLSYVRSQFADHIDPQDMAAFQLDSGSSNHDLYNAGKDAVRELMHQQDRFKNPGFEQQLGEARQRTRQINAVLRKLRSEVLKVRMNHDMGEGDGDSLWHFAAAEQGSRMYMGVRYHCSCDMRREVLDGVRSIYDILNRVKLMPGDWWRLRAGHPYGATLGVKAFGVMSDHQGFTFVEDGGVKMALDNKAVVGPSRLAKQQAGPRGTIKDGVRNFGMRAGHIGVDHYDVIDKNASPVAIPVSENVAVFTVMGGKVTLAGESMPAQSFQPGEAALILPGAALMMNATAVIPSSAMVVRPMLIR